MGNARIDDWNDRPINDLPRYFVSFRLEGLIQICSVTPATGASAK